MLLFVPNLLTNAAQTNEQVRQQRLVNFDSIDISAEDSFLLQNQETSVSSVQRLWGIPDVSTHAGRLFHLSVPPDAFSGTVGHYEVEGTENRPLPKWLTFNRTSGILEGVPSEQDTGEIYIKITAVNPKLKESVDDVFSVDVLPFSYFNGFQKDQKCQADEEITVINLVVDAAIDDLSNEQKIASIKNLAGYLGLHYSMVSLLPDENDDLLLNSVLLAGPGDAKQQRSKESSSFLWQIGCDSRVWLDRMDLLNQVKQDALEGSLSETVQMPVIGWHVSSVSNNARKRREIAGFGADNIETDNDLDEPNSRIIPTMSSPSFSFHPATVESTPLHPHRHHHGESLAPVSHVYKSPDPVISVMPTPTFDPVRPTGMIYSPPVYEMKSRSATLEDLIAPSPTFLEPASTALPDLSSSEAPDAGTPDNDDNITSSGDYPTSSIIFSPPSPAPTEKIENDTKNFPPTIQHRLPKSALTAGKVFRFKIPNDTFSDLEDDTLRLVVKMEGNPISPNSWVQFNPNTQEIYALPIEEHVSRWFLNIEAIDSGGLSVNETLELNVQHHKRLRALNHEINLYVHINAPLHFSSAVDWELFLVGKLAKLNNDPDETTHITVRSVDLKADPVVFSYTNDSLPTNQCPTAQLKKLISVLATDPDSGKVKPSVNEALHPYLSISKISWQGIGQCENKSSLPTSYPKPENYSPSTRNPVDYINATVGQLYVFKVPEDTFYDHEDGFTPNLKLSLLTLDRTPIPHNNWLQFDSKNQEFFGIPSINDTGRKEYLLVCEDKTGQAANDGLVANVQPPPKVIYSMDFSMVIDTPGYSTFIDTPTIQRHFVERLSLLFNDPDTSNIVIESVLPGSTVITWHNRSLSTEKCPEDVGALLRKVLLTDDDTSLQKRVNEVMGPEFHVVSAHVAPAGVCLTAYTEVYIPDLIVPVIDDIQPVSASGEYLVTFVIPTIIIFVMLVFSSFLACHLYRRKRTGKMSISDEDERRSFRSKGIPVIFQDELEEKFEEPSNKSPIIMKEERPPLPPPQYPRALPLPTTALLSDTEDSPYQPPPPFTTSRGDTDRQSRPKPTPTYRMPPPYVPP